MFHREFTVELSEEIKTADLVKNPGQNLGKNPPQNPIAEIKFTVVSGYLKGMTGVVNEEKISDEVTEISLQASYEGENSVPTTLMEFGGQRLASAMRTHIEELWEKEKR